MATTSAPNHPYSIVILEANEVDFACLRQINRARFLQAYSEAIGRARLHKTGKFCLAYLDLACDAYRGVLPSGEPVLVASDYAAQHHSYLVVFQKRKPKTQ